MADGHPDMTGNWAGPLLLLRVVGPADVVQRRCRVGDSTPASAAKQDNFRLEYEWISSSRFGSSRPVYELEFWDKVQYLDQWTNKEDPIMTCQPMGIPRGRARPAASSKRRTGLSRNTREERESGRSGSQ